MVIDKDVVKQVPIWVKFPTLPFMYWGEMNQATNEKEKLQFAARVLIKVEMQHELPGSITFCNKYGCMTEKVLGYATI